MNRQYCPKSAGFTLVELLVVIAVVVILLMLLLPAVGTMRARSRQAQCSSNQKQVYDGWYRATPTTAATSAAWPDKIQQFMEGAIKVMICPDDSAPVTSAGGIKASYGLNANAWHMDAQDNGRIVFLDYKQLETRIVGLDSNTLGMPTSWEGLKAPRHFFTENVTFFDGRTTSMDPQSIDPRVCEYFVKYWRPERDNLVSPPAGCVTAGSLLPGGTTTGGSTGAFTGTPTSSTTTAGTSGGTSTTTTGPPPAPCPGLTGITAQVNITAAVSGVNEGAAGQTTPVTFTISLSQALTQSVTVQVVSVDETAKAGTDYTAVNQTVTFTTGQTSQTVTVNVLGNNVSEPDKTFRVEPRNPTFGGTACQQLTAGTYARLTIYNDDAYMPPADPCKPPGAPQQVAAGFDWLIRHQFDDGSWSLWSSTHPDYHGQCTNDPAAAPWSGTPTANSNVATALALLPLLGGGSTPVSGPYRDQVCKGVNFLMASQWPDGNFGSTAPWLGVTYQHLISHLALAMAYEKTKGVLDNHCPDSTTSSGCTVDIAALKSCVELATSYTCGHEYPYPYGWRYTSAGGGDISEHAWGTAALAIASRSGTTVPATGLAHAKAFLDSASISVGPPITDSGVTIAGQYRYQVGAEGSVNQWTQMGLLSQLYLGVSKNHAAVQQYVNSHMAPDPVDNNYYSYWPLYGNMHGTQLRYFVGGAPWTTWNQAIQTQVLATQSQAGHSKGSFEIPSGRGEQASGGRLFVTVLSLLCLEPNYMGLR